MTFRWPRMKGAVALLLLALITAPAVRASIQAVDAHACCPENAPAADSPAPCQYVAPLGCCSLVAVPATPDDDGERIQPLVLAFTSAPALLTPTPVDVRGPLQVAHAHPHDPFLRTTVLRL